MAVGELIAQFLGAALVVSVIAGIWPGHFYIAEKSVKFLEWQGASALSGWIQAFGAVAAIYAAHLNTLRQIRLERKEKERNELERAIDLAKASSQVLRRAQGVLRYTVIHASEWRESATARQGYVVRLENQIALLDLALTKELPSSVLAPMLDARGLTAVALGALRLPGFHAINWQTIKAARNDMARARRNILVARRSLRRQAFAMRNDVL